MSTKCDNCSKVESFVTAHYCISCFDKIIKALQDEARTVTPVRCSCGFPTPAITHDDEFCFVSCPCGRRGRRVDTASFPGSENDEEALAVVLWNCEWENTQYGPSPLPRIIKPLLITGEYQDAIKNAIAYNLQGRDGDQ